MFLVKTDKRDLLSIWFADPPFPKFISSDKQLNVSENMSFSPPQGEKADFTYKMRSVKNTFASSQDHRDFGLDKTN